jgi:lysozyme
VKVSERGLELIQSFEGLRLEAYDDGGGVWTIGYGTTRYPDSGEPVKEGDAISQAQADEYFAADVGDFAADVGRLVHVPLSQQQFDACCSLAYNIGTGAFEKSTLLQKLNAGDYYGAADEFLRWNKDGGVVNPGLVNRRKFERALFLEGTFHPKLGTNVPTKPINESQTMPIPVFVQTAAVALAEILPALIRIKSQSPNGEINAKIAEAVVPAVMAATGAKNAQEAVEMVQADPVARDAADKAVRDMYYDLVEIGGGVTEARAFAKDLIGLPDWRGVGFSVLMGVLALVIVGGGGWMLWSLLQDPATPPEQKGMVLGAIIATIGAPVAFFFGSSASSRAKDQALIDRR